MRKWMTILCIMPAIMFQADASAAIEQGVLLKDSGLMKQTELAHYSLLEELVVLPEGRSYDKEEAKRMIQRLDLLPYQILARLNRSHTQVILFTGNLTDQPHANHLKGKVPKGRSPGQTWDGVPGAGNAQYIFVKIGASEKGNGHGSVNLEYHELAHSYEQNSTNEQMDRLITYAWKHEARMLFPGQEYFLDYKEEFFAESLAYYFYSEETRQILEEKSPTMYDYWSSI